MLILLSACLQPQHTKRIQDPIRIAIESEPLSLDPRLAIDAYSSKINALLYSGLFTYNDALELVPALLEHYEVLSPTHVRFTLKSDATFQDGRPVQSDDVIYTYTWIRDANNRSPHRDSLSIIDHFDRRSETQFDIYLKKPFAPFLNQLTLGIVPKAHGDLPSFGTHPIGAGPFEFVAWKHGQYLELKQRGTAKHIEFWFLPDENLRLLELLHGRIDLVQNGISPTLLPVLEKNPDITIDSAPGINLTYLGFQLTDPILRHHAIRKAIALAIDREKLIDYQLHRLARPASAPLPPANWAALTTLAPLPYDPESAKRLLDEAGVKDPDGEGPLPRFSLSYKTSVQKDRIEMALLIAEFLKDIGIHVSVESREWGTFFQDIKNGRFQLFSLTWVGLTDPDILYHMFHSKNRPPNGGNRGNYVSSEIDAMLEDSRDHYDSQTRQDLYEKIQRRIAEDLPYAFLWYEDNTVARRRDICGYALRPNASFIELTSTYRGECP